MRLSVWHIVLGLVVLIAAPAAGWWIGQQAVPDAPASGATPAQASGGSRGEVVSSWSTMEQAVAESKDNGKPVLIDFNAEWCGPCRSLKRELFDHPSMGRSVQTVVIPVSIVDRQREQGRNSAEVEDLQRRYGVDAFPTLVVYSPASGKHVKMRGYAGAQRTLSWIIESASSLR